MVKNAQVLADGLKAKGYTIVTGGTDNHLVLLDLRNKKLSGSKGERILEDVGISVNKNTGNLLVPHYLRLFFWSFYLCVVPFVYTRGASHEASSIAHIAQSISIIILSCNRPVLQILQGAYLVLVV